MKGPLNKHLAVIQPHFICVCSHAFGATITETLVILEIQSYSIKICMDSEMLLL